MEELREWQAANPELAAAWDSAIADDEQRDKEKAVAVCRARFIAVAADRLARMGAPLRSAEAVQAEMALPEVERKYAQSDAAVAVSRFVSGRSSFLLMFGGVGSGKTCAAVGALAQCRTSLNSPEEIAWDVSRGVFIRAAEAARLSRFDDSDRWERLLSVRWLVLDDLGVEAINDFWRERVNELLDTRYGNKLRTIITCNLSPEEFKNRYGERITSRVREDGIIAGCGERDFRRQPL